jgi:hypothetical protein
LTRLALADLIRAWAMHRADETNVRRLAPESRLGLWALGILLAVIGLPLSVLPADTETAFSWTIEPPLTAACLGACYWGSCVLVLLSARRSAWTHARVVVPGILVAGAFLLLATVIHIDRFHMDSVTGWAWLVLYSLLPPGAIALVIRQARAPGRDPVRDAPMPRWAVVVLGAQAAALVAVGAALFAAPADAASSWPWTLTPLTARATGAWLMAIGAATVQAAWEGDWSRSRTGMVGYAAIAALWLVALTRFADTPDWDDPAAWVLVLFVAAMLATGVAGAFAGAPARRRPPPDLAATVNR